MIHVGGNKELSVKLILPCFLVKRHTFLRDGASGGQEFEVWFPVLGGFFVERLMRSRQWMGSASLWKGVKPSG